MTLAPIVLFVYNRPNHTRATLNYLEQNPLADKSELFVFADGPKKTDRKDLIDQTRMLFSRSLKFKRVELITQERNAGLADSIISGLDKVLGQYGSAIILEDDILTSPNFLKFMNDALLYYRDEKRIFSISGYHPPIKIPSDYRKDIYLSYRSSSWGWATWQDRWTKVDWEVEDYKEFSKDKGKQLVFNRGGSDLTPMLNKYMNGKIDSWAIRWAYSQYKENAFSLVPVKSLVSNSGTDGSGTHFKKYTQQFITKVEYKEEAIKLEKHLLVNEEIQKSIRKWIDPSIPAKILRRVRSFIHSS